MTWSGVARALAFVTAALTLGSTAFAIEPPRLQPKALISATADEVEQRLTKIEAQSAAICPKIEGLKDFVKLEARIELLKAKSRGSALALRKALADDGVTGLPAEAALSSADTATRSAAEKAVAESSANRIDALGQERDQAFAALRANTARAAEETTKLGCDPEVCARRVVAKCHPKLREVAPTRAGPAVGVAAGVSWLSDSFAPGASRFLTERAESEVQLWLADHFQKRLCEPTTRPWFARTCSLVDALRGEGDHVPGALFAAAMRRDLEVLPLKYAGQRLGIAQEVTEALGGWLLQSREGDSPLSLLPALQELKAAKNCGANSNDFVCKLKWAAQLVELTGDAVAASETQLNASLEAWAKALVEAAKARCKDQVWCKHPTQEQAKHLLLGTFALVKRLRELSTSGRSETSSVQRGVEVASLSLSVLDAALSVYSKDDDSSIDCKKGVEWPCLRSAMMISAKLMRGEYSDGTRELIGFISARRGTIPANLRPYVPLIVDLAGARSPDEVKSALDAAAAPVGSWRVKRRATTVSVTGLVGGAAGYEVPISEKDRPGSWTGGLFVTLGVDVSVPVGTWTLGLYGSVLDVGQLVSAPISPEPHDEQGESTEADAGGEFKAVQIFSPGAYVRVGVGNSPFSFGAGAAIAPKLRLYRDYEDDTEVGDAQLTMVRVQAFFAVDVTLLPF